MSPASSHRSPPVECRSSVSLTRECEAPFMEHGRVLVVEDDTHVRDAVARALRLEGYDVHTAVDGNDGLAAHRGAGPDAIVLDVLMPGTDGLAVCRILRDRGNRTPDPDAHRAPRGVRPRRRARRGRRRLPREAVRARRAARPSPRAPAARQRDRRRRDPARRHAHARSAAAPGVAQRRGAEPHQDRVRPARAADVQRGHRRVRARRSTSGSGASTSRRRRSRSTCTSATCAARPSSTANRGSSIRCAASATPREPRERMRVSLRVRLAAVVAATFAVVVIGCVFAAHVSASHELRAETDRFLAQRSHDPRIQEGLHAPFPRGPIGGRRPGFVEPDALVQLVATDGRVVDAADPALPVDERDRTLAAEGGTPRFRTVTVDGTSYRVLTAPRRGGAVQIARSIDDDERRADDARRAPRADRAGGDPRRRARSRGSSRAASSDRSSSSPSATEEVARTQDLTSSIAVDRRDELGRLASSFNTMLAALRTSREQQKRLVIDASHELRTPLTALANQHRRAAPDRGPRTRPSTPSSSPTCRSSWRSSPTS